MKKLLAVAAVTLAVLAVPVHAKKGKPKSGWHDVMQTTGFCHAIQIGPRQGNRILSPSLGQCAFEDAKKIIELDGRDLHDTARPSVSTAQGWYEFNEVNRLRFTYKLVKPDYYAADGNSEYLRDLADWNPNCEPRMNGVTQDIIELRCSAGSETVRITPQNLRNKNDFTFRVEFKPKETYW